MKSNNKRKLISAVTIISLLSALPFTAYAAPDTTNTTTATTVAEISAETEMETDVTEETATTVATTTRINTTTTTTIVTTPSFYDEILAYVGKDNAPILNDNLDNNALSIESDTIDYSDKSMYTITTRSGDVFYLIVNSNGETFFLNQVDTADLKALLSSSSDNDEIIEELENEEEKEVLNENSVETELDKAESNNETDKKSNISNILLIVGIIAAIVVAYTISRVKIKRNNSYSASADDSFDGFEDAHDNIVSLDTTQDAQQPETTINTADNNNFNNDDTVNEYMNMEE